MIGWRDATLTGANQYALGGYIRRAMFGTPIADHLAGTEFVRIDDQVFRYAYTSAQAGKTLYLKFPSFNVYGRATQELDEVVAYSMALTPNTTTAFVEIQAQGIVNQGPSPRWTQQTPPRSPIPRSPTPSPPKTAHRSRSAR